MRDNGPNVARFLVNPMGRIGGLDHNRPGRRSDNKELMTWQ